jgi:hypothetical protein
VECGIPGVEISEYPYGGKTFKQRAYACERASKKWSREVKNFENKISDIGVLTNTLQARCIVEQLHSITVELPALGTIHP